MTGGTGTVHLWEVVVDCGDPATLGRFYADLCECELHERTPGDGDSDRADGGDVDWAWIQPATRGGRRADHGGVRIAFQRVPEPKVGKTRLHLDLGAADIPATVERAVSLGATQVGDAVTDESGTFVVLTDPEGHEFCVVDGDPASMPSATVTYRITTSAQRRTEWRRQWAWARVYLSVPALCAVFAAITGRPFFIGAALVAVVQTATIVVRMRRVPRTPDTDMRVDVFPDRVLWTTASGVVVRHRRQLRSWKRTSKGIVVTFRSGAVIMPATAFPTAEELETFTAALGRLAPERGHPPAGFQDVP